MHNRNCMHNIIEKGQFGFSFIIRWLKGTNWNKLRVQPYSTLIILLPQLDALIAASYYYLQFYFSNYWH